MSAITTMAELMGEVLRLRQQLFDEHSLHVASQLCLKAQTESVQGCAQKLAGVTQERDALRLRIRAVDEEHAQLARDRLAMHAAFKQAQERDTTSKLLTTGQLMDLVRYLDNTAEYLAGSDGIAAADILKHDAALRQQLAEVTQELESTKSAMASEYEMDMNDQIRQRKAVERQLAQRDARIAELEQRRQV